MKFTPQKCENESSGCEHRVSITVKLHCNYYSYFILIILNPLTISLDFDFILFYTVYRLNIHSLRQPNKCNDLCELLLNVEIYRNFRKKSALWSILKINWNTHHNALFFKEEFGKEFQRKNKLKQIFAVILRIKGMSISGR